MKKTIIAAFVITALILGLWLVYNKSRQPSITFPELSIDQQIGQMIMVGFKGRNVEDLEFQIVKQYIISGNIGGIILYDRNIESFDQLKKFITDIKALPSPLPLLIGIDEEGGMVTRFKNKAGFKTYDSAHEIAKTLTIGEAYAYYHDMAEQLVTLGININFAPVLDVYDKRSPAIGKMNRSFSANPEVISDYGYSFIKAMHNSKIVAVPKHFPGHGSAISDSHFGFTDVSKTWNSSELIPFKKIASDAKAIMTSHIFNVNIDKKFPASMSEIIISGNLRQFFDGIIISDDLQMGALADNYNLKTIVTQVIRSDTDILLFANFFKRDNQLPLKVKKIVSEAISNGQLSLQTIEKSFKRIYLLKKTL